jgi:DnaJ-class molecular chaperone
MTPAEIILKAKTPEDIFGPIATGVKEKFREYAVLFHPDKNHGDKNAAGVFQVLNAMKEHADRKITEGTYGDRDAMKPSRAQHEEGGLHPHAPHEAG